MRPHFVKARIKVHVCADGSMPSSRRRRIGRYDQKGTIRDPKSAA